VERDQARSRTQMATVEKENTVTELNSKELEVNSLRAELQVHATTQCSNGSNCTVDTQEFLLVVGCTSECNVNEKRGARFRPSAMHCWRKSTAGHWCVQLPIWLIP